MTTTTPPSYRGRLRLGGLRDALLVSGLAALLLTTLTPRDASARRRRASSSKVSKRSRPAARPVPALTRDGLPNVQAAAAIVVDLDTGEEVFAKHPDALRSIASVSKIFAALAVRRAGIDLKKPTEITPEDRRIALGGARSRLYEGKQFTNHDLMRAMLIASDNRAVTAVGRGAGLTPAQLVAAMNAEAKHLGLRSTRFTDPSGLHGNVSTPREVVIALRAALEDPVLAPILGTHETDVHSLDGRTIVHYNNTNVSLRTSPHSVLGGKTGYTDAARYCLAIATTISGRRFGMVFLGTEGELTRFADFSRAADWLAAADGHPKQPAHARTPGLAADIAPPAAAVTTRVAP